METRDAGGVLPDRSKLIELLWDAIGDQPTGVTGMRQAQTVQITDRLLGHAADRVMAFLSAPDRTVVAPKDEEERVRRTFDPTTPEGGRPVNVHGPQTVKRKAAEPVLRRKPVKRRR